MMATPAAPFHAMRNAFSTICLLCFSLSGVTAYAGEVDQISTDRPDFVESSNVVGNGHFQIETGLSIERNKQALQKDRTITTPTLLRLGISNTWELRLETDGRTWLRSDDFASQTQTSQRGFADTALGAKWHIQDEAGGAPSIGVLAHVDLASGSEAFRGHGARPSLRIVYEWELANDLALGLENGILYASTAGDKTAGIRSQRYASGIFGVTLAKSWTERFRTFIEFAAPQIAKAKFGGTVATLDVGAAYLLSDTVQIDTALTHGLNNRSADFNWSIGISAKF
jgi:hypothetical protein